MDVDEFQFHHIAKSCPPALRDGQPAYYLTPKALKTRSELALTIALMTHWRLFGEVYGGLQPDYFYGMPHKSGVFLCPQVETSALSKGAKFPGDIDLLVIPYEENTLILERLLVMEIKVLRGSYEKQGKSPNDFGFTQAKALLSLGFPYVAVSHLIVSDMSPEHAWRAMGRAQVIDKKGQVKILPPIPVDWLPIDLMKRAFGRLCLVSGDCQEIGLVAAFMGVSDDEIIGASRQMSVWMPETRKSLRNQNIARDLLKSVASYFDRNWKSFLNCPRYDPVA